MAQPDQQRYRHNRARAAGGRHSPNPLLSWPGVQQQSLFHPLTKVYHGHKAQSY